MVGYTADALGCVEDGLDGCPSGAWNAHGNLKRVEIVEISIYQPALAIKHFECKTLRFDKPNEFLIFGPLTFKESVNLFPTMPNTILLSINNPEKCSYRVITLDFNLVSRR